MTSRQPNEARSWAAASQAPAALRSVSPIKEGWLADLIDPVDDPEFAEVVDSIYYDELFDVLLLGFRAKPACFVEEAIDAVDGQSLDDALTATCFGRLVLRLRDGGWPSAAARDRGV